MSEFTPGLWRRGGAGRSLLQVYAFSFCVQSVQLGAVPALIALRLNAHGYPVTVLGIVAAAPWIAVLLLGGGVPALLARRGHAWVNGVALAVSGGAVLALMGLHRPALIFAANLCLGAGLILRWVACDSWVIALAPQSLRGRAIGIHESLLGGAMAGGPVIIALCGATGRAPLLACLGLLITAGYPLLRLARTGCAGTGPPVAAEGSGRDGGGISRMMTFAAFIAGFVETSSVSLLPVLSQHAGWPIASTAALALFTVGGMVGQLPVGYLADRLGLPMSQLLVSGMIAAAGVVLVLPGQLAFTVILALVVLGAAAGGLLTLAIVQAGSSGAGQVSTAAARIALAYTVGSIGGPPALGALAAATGAISFPWAFVALAAIFCAARLTPVARSAGTAAAR